MLADKYGETVDERLIELTLDGNKDALNTLINRHKDWIFNIAIGMTGDVHVAEDVTQEVLIKILTKLSTFKFKSSFRTWLYHIAKNHIFNMDRKGKEYFFSFFRKTQRVLNSLKDESFDHVNQVEKDMLVEETKMECMMGMLLCLDREQRMVFILGGIFGVNSINGSELMEMSEVNLEKNFQEQEMT